MYQYGVSLSATAEWPQRRFLLYTLYCEIYCLGGEALLPGDAASCGMEMVSVMTAAIVDKIHGTETFRMEYFVNL